MNKLIDLFMQKKWTAVIILVLWTALMMTGPMWAIYKFGGMISAEIAPISESVDRIEHIQFKQLYGAALAAYDKFDSIEDLENSTSSQNKNAIQLGLEVSEVRELLLIANRSKTMMFIEYFKIKV